MVNEASFDEKGGRPFARLEAWLCTTWPFAPEFTFAKMVVV
jgi:hypothetical protein